jgi:hypothetical protein
MLRTQALKTKTLNLTVPKNRKVRTIRSFSATLPKADPCTAAQIQPRPQDHRPQQHSPSCWYSLCEMAPSVIHRGRTQRLYREGPDH